MTTPTILQIIPQLETGGAEKTTVDIAQALLSVRAHPIVISAGGRMTDQLAEAGVKHIEMAAQSKNPITMMRNIDRLAKIIEDNQVSLIHARSRAPAWSAYYAAKKTGIPFVTTYHGAYNNKGFLKNRYNAIMASGDVTIANSEFTANLIRDQHGPKDESLRVIYRGVSLSDFARNAVSDERIAKLREEWKVQASDRVVLHASRLTNWKGQKIVIEAANQIRQRGLIHSMHFILAGDHQGRTNYLKELKELITEYQLEDHVHIVGHIDDMPAAYAVSNVAVIASTEPEAFGRVAAEAQASGRPVIVTDHGAAKETVLPAANGQLDGATGWRIPPADPEALANALVEYFAHPETQRHVMGLRARDHIASNFSLEKMCFETFEVYDELLGSRLSAVYRHKHGLSNNSSPS